MLELQHNIIQKCLKPKVMGMWLLIQQQQIVIVGNRIARKNTNSCRLRSGTLAQHQWIVYLTYAWFNIVYISTHAVLYSIICVLGCLSVSKGTEVNFSAKV